MRPQLRSALVTALMVSTVINAPGAYAASILFTAAKDTTGRPIPAGTVPVGQEVSTSEGTLQIRLDDGSLVSFVGAARFSIGVDGRLTVLSGAITVLPGTGSTSIVLPNSGTATLSGATSLKVSAQGTTGMALTGKVTLAGGGMTRVFAPGAAFAIGTNGTPVALFRAPAQPVPGVGLRPVALPPALTQNPAIAGLPAGNAAALRAYILAQLQRGGNGINTFLLGYLSAFTTPTPAPTATPAPSPTPTPTPTPPPTAGIGVNATVAAPTVVSNLYSGGPSDPGVPNVKTNARGEPTSFDYYGAPGTAILTQYSSGDGWVLGRYGNGTFTSGTSTLTYGPNDALHFVSQAPLTALPTSGTAQYTVLEATEPTFPGGARSFDDPTTVINLGVSFGASPKFGFDGKISGQVNGAAPASFSFTTAGGSANPSLTNIASSAGNFSLFGNAPVTGATANLCASDAACKFSANFIAGGAGAATFGVGWGLIDVASNKSILNGAAILTKAGTATPPTSTNPLPQKASFIGNGPAGNNVTAFEDITVTANTDGSIQRYTSSNGALSAAHGTASVVDFGTAKTATSVVAWSRWAGGTPTGSPNGYAAKTLTDNQGVVMLAGTPLTNLPQSGSAQYTLLGATSPVIDDGSLTPGTFTGKMSLDFATRRVGVDLNVAIGGTNYAMLSTGGESMPSQSEIGFSAAGQINGTVGVTKGGICTSGCAANIYGLLYGSGAAQAGLNYNISNGTRSIFGVAAFGKQ